MIERMKLMLNYLQAIGSVMEDPRYDRGTLKITCNTDGKYTLSLYTDKDLVVTTTGTTLESTLAAAGAKVLELIGD